MPPTSVSLRTGIIAVIAAVSLNFVPTALAQQVTSEVSKPNKEDSAAVKAQSALRLQDTSGKTQDEVLILSPFEVKPSLDDGYIAADTLTSGRLSSTLLSTPTDTTVLTRQFLDDIAASNLLEAGAWLTGATVTVPTDNRDFGGSISYRGLPSGGTTRNYFSSPTTPQEYVVERLEGARGPNGIIYGPAPLGGQTNVITKQPTWRSSSSVRVRVDSEGSHHAYLDVNRKVTDKIAIRINVMAQRNRTWVEGYYDDRSGIDLTAVYRPWKGATLKVEGDYVFARKASYGYVFTDTNSLWDRTTTVSAPLTANPAAATGLSRYTVDTLIYSPGLGGVVNLRNLARTNGTNLTLSGTPDRPALNPLTIPRRSFRLTPPESNLSTHDKIATAVFAQQFDNGLVLEAAAYASAADRVTTLVEGNNSYIDVNQILPNGSPNPQFGKPYGESQYQYVQYPTHTTSFRLAAAYPWVTRWFSNTFSAVAQRDDTLFEVNQFVLGRVNGAIANPRDASNQVLSRRYWDNAGDSYVVPTGMQNGNDIQYVRIRNTYLYSHPRSVQFSMVGKYLKDSLTVIAGQRFDQYEAYTEDEQYNSVQVGIGYSKLSVPLTAQTRSLGLTYFPIKQVGVYANSAEGFSPSSDGNPWLYSRRVYATNSLGKNAGLRFNLLKGKLVASLGYYFAQEHDRIQGLGLINVINQLWTDLNRPDKLLPVTTIAVVNDTLDYEGRGFEADFTASITSNFRVKANIALPRTKQFNPLPDFHRYYDENLPFWQAGANDPANPNRSRDGLNIQNIANQISNFVEGRQLNGTFDWQANVFGTYEFTNGALKGLRVGGGGNFLGKRLIGNAAGAPFSYIYNKSYFLLTASASYRLKFTKAPTDVALNVSNLLDYSDPIFNSTGTYAGVVYRNAYTYADPRKATLTITTRW